MPITIIDISQIEDLPIKELLMMQKSVLEMYDTCIKKKKIGAANAMYVINTIIKDEIQSRKENENLGIPTDTE